MNKFLTEKGIKLSYDFESVKITLITDSYIRLSGKLDNLYYFMYLRNINNLPSILNSWILVGKDSTVELNTNCLEKHFQLMV